MMAQKNTDAKASECQKCHNNHATMTAEATEKSVTAYFTLEGGVVHQFALDIAIFSIHRDSYFSFLLSRLCNHDNSPTSYPAHSQC